MMLLFLGGKKTLYLLSISVCIFVGNSSHGAFVLYLDKFTPKANSLTLQLAFGVTNWVWTGIGNKGTVAEHGSV